MIHQKHLFRGILGLVAILMLSIVASAQTFTARYNTVINSNVKGFYEYLPEGYSSSSSQKYPLMLFFHGAGERGDGSTSQLPKVLYNGVPKLIKNGTFPKSFTVNGQTHRFVIIAPQLVDVGNSAQVNDIVNYAVNNYNVDPSRIYLTGLSMGGGMCFLYLGQNSTYANRIAAMVPVCEAYAYSSGIAQNVANAGIAVWATHNNADPTVSVTKTYQYVDGINSFSPPVLAKKTIFTAASHDAWTKTYDPNFRENGLNVYEWMLQYQRGGNTVPPPNKIPTANAGADQTITLPINSITLAGSGVDLDGSISKYTWTKQSGPSQGTITNVTMPQSGVTGLVAGDYLFRLTVQDNLGATAYDEIKLKVNPQPITGGSGTTTQGRVLIDFGSKSSGVDQWGKQWNNLSNVQSGSVLTNVKTIDNKSTSIALQVINRIDGTFGTSGSGTNIGNNIGAVGDYPETATNDFAFAHYTTSSGKWRIYGLDPAIEYRIKFWGAKSHSNNYSIQIKRSDESNWLEYNASYNNSFNNAAVFTFSGKTEMSFDIRTKAGTAGFGYINVIDIQMNSTSQPVANQAPIANSGNDINLTLPNNSANISGTGNDPDGSIVSYLWKKVSGPTTGNLNGTSTPILGLSSLVEGTYVFSLTVTDNMGATGKDEVSVKVNPAVVSSGKSLQVNVFGGSNAYSNTSWNNWSIGSGASSNVKSANFKYSDGTSSTINAELSFSQAISDNGTKYGGQMAPAEVLRYTSYATVNRILTIRGLNPSKIYNFEFFASRITSGNSSIYKIGTLSQKVNTYNNLTNKISFTGIIPNSLGEVVVSISREGTYNYLNGFTITETSGAVAAKSITGENLLKIYPNPVTTNINATVLNEDAGTMQVQIVDMNGGIKKDLKLAKQTGPAQLHLATDGLPSGNYVLRIHLGTETYSQVFTKL